MSKLPDFEGIAMFAKVAEERSFAAAARAMGVSVPTVSRAVTRLEDRLGGRLFNRSSRRLALTDFGRRLAEQALRIYSEAKEVEDVGRETSSKPRGLVKLAAPLSFGSHWLAPILPAFFQQYPDVAIDVYLTDAHIDLIADGFDAALRIGILEDSWLAARFIAPIHRFLVAAPNYVARYERPQHPRDLREHRCLGYLHRPRDVWHFTHRKSGEEYPFSPTGPLRGTNVEILLPTVLEGLAITELPEFVVNQYLREKRLEQLLPDWRLSETGLYFVTPTVRARPAKVSVLGDFLIAKLTDAPWSIEASKGSKPPAQRKK